MARFRKLLALLLTLATLLSMVPVTALAAETEEVPVEVAEIGEEPEEESPVEAENSIEAETPEEEGPVEAEEPDQEDASSEEASQKEMPEEEPVQPAAAEEASLTEDTVLSGVCGDNATWTIDLETKTLSIYGTGRMYDYESTATSMAPWRKNDLIYSIETLIISEGITYIGSHDFSELHLDKISFPSTLTDIGEAAFEKSFIFDRIVLPEGVISIGTRAFKDCYGPTEIVLPSTLKRIGDAAFAYVRISSIVIPQGITEIEDYAFFFCHLTSITLPKTVKKIGAWAFYGNDFSSLQFPDMLQSIGERAFGGNPLISISFPGSLKTIGDEAFYECKQLKAVVIPPNVTEIGERAFGYFYGEQNENDLIPGFSISGSSGSAAEAYAKKNQIPFFDLDSEQRATPVLSAFSNTASGIQVTWNAVPGAAQYRVYRRVSGGSWSRLGDTTSTKYMDTTAVAGTLYAYTVRCLSADGKTFTSGYNTTGKGIVRLTNPAVTVTNTTAGVNVQWDQVPGAKGYYVYRKSGTDGYSRIATITSGSTVRYGDRTAAGGTAYTYTVRAYNGAYVSSFAGKSILRLDNPVVTVTNASGGVMVSWDAVPGAKGYYVYRKTGIGGYFRIDTITSGSTVRYADKTAVSGMSYSYTVRAYNGAYVSSFAGKSILRLDNPVVTLSNTTAGINIQWNEVPGAKGYYVYRKSGSGGYSRIAAITGGSTVRYGDRTAVGGTTYTYTVRAYNGAYLSSFADKSIVRLTNPVVTVTNASGGVVVSWEAVPGATGYYVYRKTSDGGYTRIKTITGSSTLSCGDTGVKNANGTLYTYTVRAYNGSVLSSFAGKNIVRLTTPTISSVTNSASQAMTVEWNKNAAATGYQVYYKVGTTAKAVTVAGNANLSKVITGLTQGSTYTVYVRSYQTVSGVNYFSGWSAAKTVKINQ